MCFLLPFRLCAVLAISDHNVKTAGLFGVHSRFDIHAPADSGALHQPDRRRRHGQVQMSTVRVRFERSNHVPVGVFAVDNTRHGVKRGNQRYGRDQVAVVLDVLRHDHSNQHGRHGEDRFRGHDLHGLIR